MAAKLLAFPFISIRGTISTTTHLHQLSPCLVQMRCGISNGKRLENRKHLETQIYPQLYTGVDPPKGAIYDKKPFRMEVQAGKVYLWCSCGQSKTQPFCDRTHLYEEGNARIKTKPRFRPVKYVPEKTKTVYFCNCKQTGNRPFCDNTHKQQHIEECHSLFKN
ncbi:hypothetical protein EB796_015107 [Bugula neritina]|uniref:Iron-binding zinc finger CDGSH type domain-containing protein n=1 Tax=Bugula neritina TaxID=10212 RepID=A0A7J7JMC2_BUGNE|nr:hypothetical protein EB796_015107 [Bugula neritina]